MKNKRFLALCITLSAAFLLMLITAVYSYSIRKEYTAKAAEPGVPLYFKAEIYNIENGFIELYPEDLGFTESKYLIVAVDSDGIAYISNTADKKPSDDVVYIDNRSDSDYSEEEGFYSTLVFATSGDWTFENCESAYFGEEILVKLDVGADHVYVDDVLIDGISAEEWLKENCKEQ